MWLYRNHTEVEKVCMMLTINTKNMPLRGRGIFHIALIHKPQILQNSPIAESTHKIIPALLLPDEMFDKPNSLPHI